jgi:hypothetical protein
VFVVPSAQQGHERLHVRAHQRVELSDRDERKVPLSDQRIQRLAVSVELGAGKPNSVWPAPQRAARNAATCQPARYPSGLRSRAA